GGDSACAIVVPTGSRIFEGARMRRAMKTKLLFVMPSLSAGGGEKSLVNLLAQFDYSRYEVDLFLLHHEGIFMPLLPKEVRVLPLPDTYAKFALPLPRSVWLLLRSGKLKLAFHRVLFALHNARSKGNAVAEQHGWKYISRALESLKGHYDAAIGFMEKTSTYLCVDKVRAARKIGWVHVDYDQLGMDPRFD